MKRVAILAGENYPLMLKGCIELLQKRSDVEIVGIDLRRKLPKKLRSSTTEKLSYRFAQRGYMRDIPPMDLEEIEKTNPDVVFSISYPNIISGDLLKKRCINWHMGKLPKYRGRHPVIHAIMENQLTITATFHLMEEKLDAGNILAETQIPISILETGFSAAGRLELASKWCIQDRMNELLNETYMGRVQKGKGHNYKAAELDKFVCMDDDPLEIWNKVRALNSPYHSKSWTGTIENPQELTTENVRYDVDRNRIERL
jgi:methionyl-tRNA formyltransferase